MTQVVPTCRYIIVLVVAVLARRCDGGPLACLRTCADKLAYPQNARAHFDEIHRRLENYSHVPRTKLAGYGGPWIENLWISSTRAAIARADAAGDTLRDVAGPFIPLLVPWLDAWLAKGSRMWYYPPGMIHALLDVLEPNVPYVTVSQNDNGVTGDCTRERPGQYQFDAAAKAPNLLVFSAGGYGHIPVPLLKQPEPIVHRKPIRERRYFASYLGSLHTAPRRLRYVMNDTLHAFAAAKGVDIFVGKARNWKGIMADSKFSLCPRGFGRTSYHLAESINMGLVPVHIYADTPWLPYPRIFPDVGFNTSIDGFGALLEHLFSLSDAEVASREANAERLSASHFNFDAVLSQIRTFLVNGTGDLVCRNPPTGTRLIDIPHPSPVVPRCRAY